MSRTTLPTAGDDALSPFPVVGIGASAGGVEALSEFLDAMPADSGMAFVLVLHLDPEHRSALAEILTRHTAMPVLEVTAPVRPQPDHVYVIAPNTCLEYRDGELVPRAPDGARPLRRPVDALLRSLALGCGHRAIGVILSGGGSDGTLGLKAIHEAGGLVLVQTPETALQDSMPRSAIEAGLADHVLAVADMQQVLLEYLEQPYPGVAGPAVATAVPGTRLEDVLALLRTRQDYDFRCYKKNMLARRVQRRMSLLHLREPADYLARLQGDAAEIDALAGDLMISVTQFFRNPPAWEQLGDLALDELCALASAERPLRAWLPACASGEEAYSLAMLLLERLPPGPPPVQIFASDISHAALAIARAGLYPDSIEADVSAQRLARFFSAEGTHYRVSRELRDCVIFATQNLLSDPPFGRLDLISCRNVMIYLEPDMQDSMLALFHFALRPGGYLFLGNVESIGPRLDLFEPVTHRWRLYRRIDSPRFGRDAPLPAAARTPGLRSGLAHPDGLQVPVPVRVRAPVPPANPAPPAARGAGAIAGLVQQIVLERYTQACVLVSRRYEILYFFGPTHEFLRQPVGERTADLLAWAHEGLRGTLRTALHEAATSHRPVRQHGRDVPGTGSIECIVERLQVPRELDGLLLVAFARRPPVEVPPPRDPAGGDKAGGTAIAQLEFELGRAHEEICSITEQLDSAYEEFTASNEEVMSINEELQSANEELETSKEELQSLNEELVTSNQQLESKNQQLEEINADLRNLLASTQIATLFLDDRFRIRRYTPAMAQLMRVIPGDIGRSIGDISCDFDRSVLLAHAAQVLEHLTPVEYDLCLSDGRWHLCRVLPYRTEDNRICGVVVTFTDVTDRHRLAVREHLIRDFNDRLTEIQTPADVIAAVSELLGRHFGALWCRCVPVDADQQWLHVEGPASGARLPLAGLAAETLRLLRRGQPLIVAGSAAGADISAVLGAAPPTDGSVLLLAAVAEGRLLALVGIGHDHNHAWSDEDLDLVRVFAERAWLAIEKIEANRALIRRATQLAAADRLKNEFLATLGHELRNPLVPIRSTLDLLLGTDADLDGGLQARLQLIDRQVVQLQRLVDDLLDASRIEQIGRIRLQMRVLDVDEVLRMAIESQQPRFSARAQEFRCQPPAAALAITGDRVRLVQAVGNLLHNASRYSPAGARIELMAVREGGEAVIRVRDNGRGIAPERLAHIFELFVRHDPDAAVGAAAGTGNDGPGFGIGLALARRLVELHGGSLTASSPGVGGGSTFTLRLPLASTPAAPQPAPAVAIEPAPPQPRRVLIVDDNEDVCSALALLLEAMGHEVSALGDGREVIAAVERLAAQVVLLDLAMPGMDGYEVARALRSRHPVGTLRLIALTGFGSADDLQRVAEAGFDQHLLKPASREQLAAALA